MIGAGHEIHCFDSIRRAGHTFFSEKVMGHLRGSVPARAAELIVVRHGETSWNVCGRFQGQEEADLSDNGVLQAQAVASRLGKGTKDVAVVYSSDLRRAVDTARPIADQCGVHEVLTVASLRERHLGKLQGLTRAESVVMAPEALQASLSDNADEPIPGGGESLNDLYSRAKKAIEDIARKHLDYEYEQIVFRSAPLNACNECTQRLQGYFVRENSGSLADEMDVFYGGLWRNVSEGQRVIVVTHGGFLRAMHFHAEGRVPTTRVLNTCVNVFHITASNEWILRSWGDVNHLRGIEILRSKAGGDELT